MNQIKLNRSDFKLIGAYLILTTFWLLYRFTIEGYSALEYFVDIPVAIVQIVLLLIIVVWLVEFYFIRNGSLIVFIGIGFLSLWFIGFLSMLSGDLTKFGKIPWHNYDSVWQIIIANVHNSIYNIAIPILLISGKKYHEYQIGTAKLINYQKELELKLLRSQFDPHFLYNSLNTIDALVDFSSKERIKEYISSLSAFYRYLTKTKDEEVISLNEEIEIGEKYLLLEETRFEDDYNIQFFYETSLAGRYLPSGAFLTVLENVIKHNKAVSGDKIEVRITITSDTLNVWNSRGDSNTVDTKESDGVGLANLKKQYELLSDDEVIVSETKDSFFIGLPLLKIAEK